jgi:hypothetical protein
MASGCFTTYESELAPQTVNLPPGYTLQNEAQGIALGQYYILVVAWSKNAAANLLIFALFRYSAFANAASREDLPEIIARCPLIDRSSK